MGAEQTTGSTCFDNLLLPSLAFLLFPARLNPLLSPPKGGTAVMADGVVLGPLRAPILELGSVPKPLVQRLEE